MYILYGMTDVFKYWDASAKDHQIVHDLQLYDNVDYFYLSLYKNYDLLEDEKHKKYMYAYY